MKNNFVEYYGPYALIAGASQGLGESFAKSIAKRGINVILISRREKELKELAKNIEEQYSVKAIVYPLDLTSEIVGESIQKLRDKYEINLLVYNAALSPIGSFFTPTIETHHQVIKLNCKGPMELSYYLIPKMMERRHGGVILMSSLSAFQGTPMIGHYGATKAYNLTLAEALWDECSPLGVHVMAVPAGMTTTPNLIATHPKINVGIKPPIQTPDQVSEQSLKKLMKNKPYFIPGWKNRFSSFIMRKMLPRTWTIKIIGYMNRKMYS